MSRRIPYLSEQSIERDAELLLGEFMLARHVGMEPPISSEDIVEKHLKLGIEFDDLHRLSCTRFLWTRHCRIRNREEQRDGQRNRWTDVAVGAVGSEGERRSSTLSMAR